MKALGMYNQTRLWTFVILYSAAVGLVLGAIFILVVQVSVAVAGVVAGIILGVSIPVIIGKNESWFLEVSSTDE